MKRRILIAGTTVALAVAAGVAQARNPHCAGGIQYVVQALNDSQKGNHEDYLREMNKAVDQLNQCATEDPNDFEAMGYLGWAYAELDSAGPAGTWFQKSIDGLTTKGDKKKVEVVTGNRDHYWTVDYNDGIKGITDAQAAYPDFTKAPTDDEKPLKETAQKSYDTAISKLTKAKLLKPGHAQTIRNLATAYALTGQFDAAEAVLRNGVAESASDTAGVRALSDALHTVRANKASALLDAKKYDEAIAYYTDLAKAEPNNGDHYMGLGNALFSRAATKQDAARRADFKASGDAYVKAFALNEKNTDLGFNAALAYQNAGELASSEAAWRAVLKVKPDDPDAMSSLGSVLADMQKYPEAEDVLLRAIGKNCDNKIYYRQLSAVYSKWGNNPKSTELIFVYMAKNAGKPAADAAAAAKAAKAGSAAANTGAAMGAPDAVLDWDSEGRKLQTWIYCTKKQAFTFDAAAGMGLLQKSDWSAPAKK